MNKLYKIISEINAAHGDRKTVKVANIKGVSLGSRLGTSAISNVSEYRVPVVLIDPVNRADEDNGDDSAGNDDEERGGRM